MRKYFLSALLVCCLCAVHAQRNVVVERFRCLSSLGPVMGYLRIPAIRDSFATQLGLSLTENGYPPLSDAAGALNLQFPPRLTAFDKSDVQFNGNDTSLLHLYIDFLEVAPAYFFSATRQASADSTMAQRAKSVWVLTAHLFNHQKKQLFSEEIDVVLSHPVDGPGMGVAFLTSSGWLNITPRGFIDVFRMATRILFNPRNELGLVELKVPPAFLGDDFIIPKTTAQPRTIVTRNKNIHAYTISGKSEMIRLGEPMYEEINLSQKDAQVPPALFEAMRQRPAARNSDFVMLRQENRDVLRDKNYTLRMPIQINPAAALPQPFTFTGFLPGEWHCLLLEKDTVALFSIQADVVDSEKHFYPGIVSNGIDSASFMAVNTRQQPVPVQYNYVMKGTIGKHSFSIYCSGNRNSLKEIYLDDRLVCIAQGKFNPEKFVLFNASLSPEILNPLLMIGFNAFLE